jgi:hypothetical protein
MAIPPWQLSVWHRPGISFTGMDQFSIKFIAEEFITGNPRKLSMSEAFKNTLEQIAKQLTFEQIVHWSC